MKAKEVLNKLHSRYKIRIQITTLYEWERRGLLGNVIRGTTNRRVYSEDNVQRIFATALLTHLGLCLNEVKLFFDGDYDTNILVVEILDVAIERRNPDVKLMVAEIKERHEKENETEVSD